MAYLSDDFSVPIGSHGGGQSSAKSVGQFRQKRLSQLTKAPVNSQGICHFFRSVFPDNTAAEVAAVTGISINTVNNVLHGKSGMGAPSFAICAVVFGPDFLAAALSVKPAWLERSLVVERKARLNARRVEIEADLAGFDG